MPSLISFGKTNTTGIDLSANSFWRVTMGAASATEMALVVIYPPGGPTNRIALVKTEVLVAKNPEEIEKVAQNCVSMGSLELDIARATEAMNLFRMHGHVGEKQFEEALSAVLQLVRTYWVLRNWLESGMDTVLTHEISGYKLVGRP